MVHPEFFISDDVAALSIPARLTFIGLWCYFDDDGRGKDSAAAVRAAVWGMDDDVTTGMVAAYLTEIEAVEGICRYTADGHKYMHAPAWTNWQKVSHPADPRVPPCPKHGGRPAKEDGRRKGSGNTPETYGDSPESLPSNSPQVVSAVSAVEVSQDQEVEALAAADHDHWLNFPNPDASPSRPALRAVSEDERAECSHDSLRKYCAICQRERRTA